MGAARKLSKTNVSRKKRDPGEIAPLRGPTLGSFALAVPVKPFGHTVCDYVCSDRHEETDQDLQGAHLLPVARLEKGSNRIMAGF